MKVFRNNKPTILVFGRGEIYMNARKESNDMVLMPRSADAVQKMVKRVKQENVVPRPKCGDVILRFPNYESIERVIGALLRMFPADLMRHPRYGVLQAIDREMMKSSSVKIVGLAEVDLDIQRKKNKDVYTTFWKASTKKVDKGTKRRVFKHPALGAPYGKGTKRKGRK